MFQNGIVDNSDDKKILFWNCKGNDTEVDFQKCLCNIINEENVEIVGLCECKEDPKDFAENINNNGKKFRFVNGSEPIGGVAGKIHVFSTLSNRFLKKKTCSKRFVNVNLNDKFDLCFVHLKSLVNTPSFIKMSEDECVVRCAYKNADKDKFFIGDFNAPPYEDSMLYANIFNTRRIGEKEINRCGMTDEKIRINPCWSAMGADEYDIYGSYKLKNEIYSNIGWYLFDQVVFDEKLEQYYRENSFKVISTAKSVDLLDLKGNVLTKIITTKNSKKQKTVPKYSDHLPIIFSLKGV